MQLLKRNLFLGCRVFINQENETYFFMNRNNSRTINGKIQKERTKLKKVIFIFFIATLFLLSACSAIEEVNNSVDYVKEAKDQMHTMREFAEEAPQLIKDANSNPKLEKELENELTNLQEKIQEFNAIDAPFIAEDLHQQLIGENEKVLEEIKRVIDNGEIAIEKLENSPILDTINDVNKLLNDIQNLGI